MPLLTPPRRRRLLFASLYFSEGAPIGYVWWAMPTRLRDAGMPIEQVTAITSLLVLPWAFKFLWAPLVDTLRTPRWGLRSWVLLAQLAMGVPLLLLMRVDLASQAGLVTGLLLVHAICAATQDVAIDALAIRATPSGERGSINAWMQGGMLCARGVFGGASLWAERYLGANVVLGCLVLTIWASGALLIFLPPDVGPREAPSGGLGRRAREVGRTLLRALERRSTWLGLLFALIAGAGFETVGAVAGPMLRDRGHTADVVGLFYAGPVIVTTVIGGFIGGQLSDRYGRARIAGWCVAATAACVATLAGVVAAVGPGAGWGVLTPQIAALTLTYLMVGALTASSYALFMDLTDPEIGATEFSAFMGATNLCESWSARLGGRVAGSSGYPAAWLLAAAISLLAIPLLRLMPPSARRTRTPAMPERDRS